MLYLISVRNFKTFKKVFEKPKTTLYLKNKTEKFLKKTCKFLIINQGMEYVILSERTNLA